MKKKLVVVIIFEICVIFFLLLLAMILNTGRMKGKTESHSNIHSDSNVVFSSEKGEKDNYISEEVLTTPGKETESCEMENRIPAEQKEQDSNSTKGREDGTIQSFETESSLATEPSKMVSQATQTENGENKENNEGEEDEL